MTQRLFVYGTLGEGKPNEHILKNIGGDFKKAWVTGILKDQGWGAALGYPGITLDPNGEKVEGFLFSSDNLVEHWPRLDEFEGAAYERVLTSVQLEGKTTIKAYIYVLREGIDDS